MDSEDYLTEDVENECEAIFKWIMAGLKGDIIEFQVSGISLSPDDNGGFRVVLRGWAKNNSTQRTHLVGFTNGSSPAEALSLAEAAFRDGAIRWYVDGFRNDDGLSSNSGGKRRKLTLA